MAIGFKEKIMLHCFREVKCKQGFKETKTNFRYGDLGSFTVRSNFNYTPLFPTSQPTLLLFFVFLFCFFFLFFYKFWFGFCIILNPCSQLAHSHIRTQHFYSFLFWLESIFSSASST